MSARFFTALDVDHPHGRLVAVGIDETVPITPGDEALLLPEEKAVFQALSERRKETWLAGRVALISALERIGAPRVPIASDDRGAPIVARGARGSISHKPKIALGLAAFSADAGIGVDVEELDRPRMSIESRILTDRELALSTTLNEHDRWIALIARFAIKEAIYKAIDPFVRRYVGFKEAEIRGFELVERCLLSEPKFHQVEAVMTVPEGSFLVEASWSYSEVVIATARIIGACR